jgi:[ribosomal protein S5]-alanine N-acetyltransferase
MTLDGAFRNPPAFQTKRLVLRPIRNEDAGAMYEIRSDVLVTERYGHEPSTSLEEVQRFVQVRVEGFAKREALYWVYGFKNESRIIGSCCLWNFDPSSRCAEIGYELHREFWGKGITSEALPPVITFGFAEMDLHRIEGLPFSINEPSTKVLSKLGFTNEGTFREKVYFRGRFLDQICFGLLKKEWMSRNG